MLCWLINSSFFDYSEDDVCFYAFQFSQIITSLEQRKADMKSLFAAPRIDISCKIVDGKTLKQKLKQQQNPPTKTLLDSLTRQSLCFCSQLKLCY